MYTQKEKATKDNVNKENNLIESGTNRLINFLYNRTSDFSDIGAGWGQAIADAFNSILDNLTANIPYSATYNFEQGQRSRASSNSQVNNYNFNQTVNANNFSPIKARKEMEQLLNRARYL